MIISIASVVVTAAIQMPIAALNFCLFNCLIVD